MRVRQSPCISLHRPASPCISLYLPASPYISLHLPASTCTSVAICESGIGADTKSGHGSLHTILRARLSGDGAELGAAVAALYAVWRAGDVDRNGGAYQYPDLVVRISSK